MKQFILIISLAISIVSWANEAGNYKNNHCSFSALIDSFQINKDSIEILIDKSDYILSIFYDSLVIKEYPIVLGGNPIDDKLIQGDRCTPEGIFYMVSKYPHKSWSKFIWINYPSEESWKKHMKAKEEKVIPANAQIGGEIGIHGVPENMDYLIDQRRNWTLGCISLKNKDINEIFPFINEKTRIEIRK